MDIQSLKPNSDKYKEQQKTKEKQQKAIAGTARPVKKPFIKRFIDIFIAEDIPDLKEYILYERILPALKTGFLDTVHSTVDIIFGNDSKRRGNSSPSGSRVSYTSYYDKDKPQGSLSKIRGPEDILFDTRDDAEMALDALTECVSQFEQASIGDFYDIAGVTGNGYSDYNYGWRDLRSAYVLRRPDGYIISFPRAIDLK